jgi:peroxiredoxin
VTTVAIVAQKSAAVQAWLREHALPFTVLIDESRDTLRAYGVWHRVGFDAWNIARPALFLIKPGRSVARSFVASNQREFPPHQAIVDWITG